MDSDDDCYYEGEDDDYDDELIDCDNIEVDEGFLGDGDDHDTSRQRTSHDDDVYPFECLPLDNVVDLMTEMLNEVKDIITVSYCLCIYLVVNSLQSLSCFCADNFVNLK